MNIKDLILLGVPQGEPVKRAQEFILAFRDSGGDMSGLQSEVAAIVANPVAFLGDPLREAFARALYEPPSSSGSELAPWRQWGDGLEPEAVMQMENACALPVAVAGALMPDAHVGYGLPIGGVLATENAVIPYAVGVDIACRMKLTVLDSPGQHHRRSRQDRLTQRHRGARRASASAPSSSTAASTRCWTRTGPSRPVTQQHKDKAWAQLGTSGSGNHFVEFGAFTVARGARELGLEPGSTSRCSRTAARAARARRCATTTASIAMGRHRELPKRAEAPRVARSLDSQAGQEYWAAMNLMGHYAAANHALIHRTSRRKLGADVIARRREPPQLRLEGTRTSSNGDEREVIVHRKGATPAGAGVLGVIPGSMASPGFVVRGKGNAGVAQLGLARRRPRDEPHEGDADLHLERGEEAPRRARRDAHLAPGSTRCPACLQGHPRRSWPRRPTWWRSSAGSIRSS